MLGQQFRQLEEDGIVGRTVPAGAAARRVLPDPCGQSLCPAMDGLLLWLEWKGRAPDAAANPDIPETPEIPETA